MEKSKGITLFKRTDVLVLINHAINSKEFKPTIEEAYNDDFTKKSDDEIKKNVKAGLHLIKDSGVYLMSNGNPGIGLWQVDIEYKKSIKKECEDFKKSLIKNKEFWRDRVQDFVDAPKMNPFEFTQKFGEAYEGYNPTDKQYVVYAEKLNPYIDDRDSVWHNSRRLCGGNDFSELISYNIMLHIKTRLTIQKIEYLAIEWFEDSFHIKFI